MFGPLVLIEEQVAKQPTSGWGRQWLAAICKLSSEQTQAEGAVCNWLHSQLLRGAKGGAWIGVWNSQISCDQLMHNARDSLGTLGQKTPNDFSTLRKHFLGHFGCFDNCTRATESQFMSTFMHTLVCTSVFPFRLLFGQF